MKPYLLVALVSIMFLTNCSIEDNGNDNTSKVTTLWNLINVSGGIAGVDNNFDMGDIVWTFNEVTSTLTVNNNNSDDGVEDGLNSGSYPYYVYESDEALFLIINTAEYGGFTVLENQLIIDQNSTSTGSGADGYVYTFQKSLVIIN